MSGFLASYECPAHARLSTLKRTRQARAMASAQDSMVAPVVMTSSTNKIWRPSKLSGCRTAKMSRTFSRRCRWSKVVWLGLDLVRTTLVVSVGMPMAVAPLPFLFPGQGNGHDKVYPVEKACGFQFLGHHTSHGFPYFGMVMVFQFEQNAAVRRVWGVMEKRNSFLDGNQSPKYAGDVVFFKRNGPDTWKVGLASYAEHLFTRRHAPAATKAIPGEEKVQKGL